MTTRLGAVCLGIAAALTLAACSGEPAGEAVGASTDALQVCATTTLTGVDVSHHNGSVSWSKVKSSGRVFAFARVSDGLTHPDERFAANWPAMKSAGLVRGVYQYFRASRDAVQQADLLVKKVANAGGLKAGDLPPVLDLETDDGKPASVVVAGAKKWLARVESKLHVKPIVYTGNNMSQTIGESFASYVLWVPHYGVECPRVPAGWSTWSFWQDAEDGNVPGISGGGVDTDFFNGKRADLDALTIGHTVDLDEATLASLSPDAVDDGADDGNDAAMGSSR
jgi:lysozyme